jgi:hypothetical protein
VSSYDEQETVITFGRLDTECEVYTTDPTVMTKLDKRVADGDWRQVDTVKESGQVVGKTYKGNKKLVRFVNRQVKHEYTEEQLQVLRERMKKMQEARKVKKGE